MRILLLGGTAEARTLAGCIAAAGFDAIYSYAGRTARPAPQPLPVRVGGFGGVDGLAAFLAAEGVTHVVDATHPFAANISRNAIAACARAGVGLVALERPPWQPPPGAAWADLPDVQAAVAALPAAGARVFLAIGRQHVEAFAARPDNFYLLRFVDPPARALPMPRARVVVARGPFSVDGDRALMAEHAITHLVARNGGGPAARAKLDAAQALGVKVLMIARPMLPAREVRADVEGVMDWLRQARQVHRADLGV